MNLYLLIGGFAALAGSLGMMRWTVGTMLAVKARGPIVGAAADEFRGLATRLVVSVPPLGALGFGMVFVAIGRSVSFAVPAALVILLIETVALFVMQRGISKGLQPAANVTEVS